MEHSPIMSLLTTSTLAAVILIGGIWLSKKLKVFLNSQLITHGFDPLLAGFAASIAHILIITFTVIATMAQLGIQTTSLVAIIGAAGLAIGLALQGSLANFASGVIVIAFRPFKVGDFIEAGGVSGIVENIQIFSTQLRSGDNKTIIVPNSSITGSSITNYSTKDTRRVDMVFSIGYGDDLKQAKLILHDIVDNDDRILENPEPLIAVSELADSSVNFLVRPWVKSEDYWPVLFDTTEQVKLRFDAEGISIPYPQHDIHIHQSSH